MNVAQRHINMENGSSNIFWRITKSKMLTKLEKNYKLSSQITNKRKSCRLLYRKQWERKLLDAFNWFNIL